MTSPTYGVIFNETTTAPYAVAVGDMSVIGIVTTVDDAAASSFPLNTPVAFNSSDPAWLANIGTGALAQAVQSINEQLAQFESAATLVVVVVPNGTGTGAAKIAGTIANLVGSQAAGTGIYALLKAGQITGFIPRIVIVPGYTGYAPLSVASASIVGGVGVTSATQVTFSPAGATGVVQVNAGVASINMTNPGSYAPGTTITATLSGGGYSAGTVTVTTQTTVNPLLATLPAVLTSLSAVAYVADAGDGVYANAIAWRQLLASDRLAPCDAWVIPGGNIPALGAAYTDGVAEAAGLQVAVDFAHGGLPGWSISGHQVLGIAGLKNYYPFSLTDGSTEGQQLLANQISTIEAGVIASDTAAASSGFVWQGVWNASTLSTTWFLNKRRMKDWCYLQLIKTIRRHLGLNNTTPQSIQDVLNDMQVLGAFLLSQQISIGFAVTFQPSLTSPTNLQQGQFTLGFANEVPAPITLVTILASDYYQALIVEEQTIIAEASGITPEYISAASSSTSTVVG